MKITIDGKVFRDVYKKVKPFIQKCVWISAADDAARVIATDAGSFTVSVNAPAKIDEPGEACIDLRDVTIPDGEVTIETDENGATVSAGNGKTRCKCGEWNKNLLLNTKEGERFTIRANDLLGAISSVDYCYSRDETTPIHQGILFEISDGCLRTVALDGYSLAMCEKEIGGSDINCSFILDGKTLKEWRRTKPHGDICIEEDRNTVRLTSDESSIALRKKEGHFLNFRQCMLKESKTRAMINKKDLIAFASQHKKALMKSNKPLRLDINNDGVDVTAIGATVDASAHIDAKVEGADLVIGVNPVYIQETLEAFPADEVVMCFGKEYDAIMICNPEYEKNIALIMPVRVK